VTAATEVKSHQSNLKRTERGDDFTGMTASVVGTGGENDGGRTVHEGRALLSIQWSGREEEEEDRRMLQPFFNL
jgi:hypothetical protein